MVEPITCLLVRRWERDGATMGILTCPGHTLYSLELPWLDNEPQHSCIPEGVYPLHLTMSPRFGRVYEIWNVPGRTHILIHAGNTTDDTQGCVLVGTSRGSLQHKPAVLNSRQALKKFNAALAPYKGVTIDVRRAD